MLGVKEREFKRQRKELGFVFQDPATSFNPLLTIAQNVAEPLIVHTGVRDAAAAQSKVDELLEAVQLPKAFGDTLSRTNCPAVSASGPRSPAPSRSTRSC